MEKILPYPVYHIRIDVTPMGAPRQTQRDKWKKRPVIERYHSYRDVLRLMTVGYELPNFLNATFTIPFPASYSKKKRDALRDQPHDQKPDIDNLCKAVMDALKNEDKNIHSLNVTKVWGDTGSLELTLKKQ